MCVFTCLLSFSSNIKPPSFRFRNRFLRRLEKSIKTRSQFMAVATSDSGPEADDNSDSCLDSPKITSPLLRQTGGGGGGSAGTTQSTNQKQPSHVLMRQKASYRNSVDI